MTDDTQITFHKDGGSTHTGDAVRLYQARVVRQGLKACLVGLRLNRSYTPTNCLRTAATFTGVKYGRGKSSLKQAIADLDMWIAACESSVPIVMAS